jgi:F-type H+-transporting ATPase subunit b
MDIFPNWTVFPIVFFLIVLTYILNRNFFRPLGQVLKERSRLIEGARKEAEEIRVASQNRMTEFENKMRDARRQADQIMADMDKKVQEERGTIIASQRADAKKMVAESRAEIKSKADEAGRELQSQSDHFAQLIASHLLKRPLQKGSGTAGS